MRSGTLWGLSEKGLKQFSDWEQPQKGSCWCQVWMPNFRVVTTHPVLCMGLSCFQQFHTKKETLCLGCFRIRISFSFRAAQHLTFLPFPSCKFISMTRGTRFVSKTKHLLTNPSLLCWKQPQHCGVTFLSRLAALRERLRLSHYDVVGWSLWSVPLSVAGPPGNVISWQLGQF